MIRRCQHTVFPVYPGTMLSGYFKIRRDDLLHSDTAQTGRFLVRPSGHWVQALICCSMSFHAFCIVVPSLGKILTMSFQNISHLYFVWKYDFALIFERKTFICCIYQRFIHIFHFVFIYFFYMNRY